MKSFKDIVAWQKAYAFTLQIYKFSKKFPRNEEFGLTSQLRRASVSVISNIAEGFKRLSKKEQLRFYNQSQSSLEECKCQLLLAYDLEYLDDNQFNELEQLSEEASRTLYGWIKSQKL